MLYNAEKYFTKPINKFIAMMSKLLEAAKFSDNPAKIINAGTKRKPHQIVTKPHINPVIINYKKCVVCTPITLNFTFGVKSTCRFIDG